MSSRVPSPPHAAGFAAGVAAYLWWGLSPLYWHALAPVAAIDVIAHRALWAVPCCALLLAWRGHLGRALAVLRQPRNLLLLATSSALVASNWWLFVWSVGAGQIAQASLGYFLQPLLTVLIGLVFFHERLTPMQWLAVAFAAAGVLVYATSVGEPPLLALGVAVSFALYGALRKHVSVDSVDGLFVETLLLAPVALGWILYHDGAGLGTVDLPTSLLLVLSGAFTAFPLIAYVSAARRLPLATLGLLFYLNPSCQLLVAVCWFGEPLHAAEAWTFALVWIGVLLYLGQLLNDRMRGRSAALRPPALD
jgi:chloramphenicol-sensitive protein RarD